jgi:hypothetical protein
LLTSRIDTLEAPTGAFKIPIVAILTVAAVAGIMVLVGLSGWGWLIAMFVPMLALTTYIVVNTLRVMTGKI